MMRPTLVFGFFLALYSVASYLDPVSGFLAALSFALLWPAVWQASTIFRLSKTSYKAWRFGFDGSLEQAYLHIGLPMLLFIFPTAWLGVNNAVFQLHSVWTVLSVAGLLVWLALYPVIFWQVKRLLHGRVVYGSQRFALRLNAKTVFAAFNGFYLAVGVVICLVLAAAAIFKFQFFEFVSDGLTAQMSYYRVKPILWIWFAGLVLVWFVVLQSIGIQAAHNMIWSRTLGQGVRLRAKLDAVSVMKLQARNTTCMVLSFGIFWPWAKIAMLRLRLESVSLECTQPLDDLLASMSILRDVSSPELSGDLSVAEIGL